MSDIHEPSQPSFPHNGADAGPASVREAAFRWGPILTIVWTLVIALVTLVVVLGAGILAGLVEWSRRADPETAGDGAELALFVQERIVHHMPVLTILQGLVVVALVMVLTRRRGSLTRSRMLGLEPIAVWRCLKWVAIGFVSLVVLTEIPQFFMDLGQDEALEWMGMLQPAWLGFVLLTVLAPLSEELLFRGFLYGGLAQSRIGPIGAIVATSGIWTVIHVQYTWLIMTQVFIYGIVFGAVRWRSGSLWPPMLTHGLVNLLAGLVFYSGFEQV